MRSFFFLVIVNVGLVAKGWNAEEMRRLFAEHIHNSGRQRLCLEDKIAGVWGGG